MSQGIHQIAAPNGRLYESGGLRPDFWSWSPLGSKWCESRDSLSEAVKAAKTHGAINLGSEEIGRHTFPTPLSGILQTVVILESPTGDVYATVAAHARGMSPPENATCTVTDEAEVARLAAEVVAAKRAERPRPAGTQMLARSRAQPSTTAGG